MRDEYEKPPDVSDDFLPGFLLKQRYRIERELGRGGFGIVYLASDENLHGRSVVIKVLREAGDHSDWRFRKFQQEIQILARMRHPGIVGVLDKCETPEGKLCLVMEYVDGMTLRKILGAGAMALSRAGNLILQVAEALAAAHDKGICHRDLKPENIMVRNVGSGRELAVVIDFGIAAIRKAQDGSSGITKVAGSPGYMAPEQLAGRPEPASDIYALGVISYEMITGTHPLRAYGPGGVRDPMELRNDLPGAGSKAIVKALSHDVAARYQRVLHFGEDLAAALHGRELLGRTLTIPLLDADPLRFGRRLRRSRIVQIAGFVLLVVCGALVMRSQMPRRFVDRMRGSRMVTLAVLPFTNSGGNPEMEHLSDGVTEDLIDNLSQVHNISVLSRNAVFKFRGREADAQIVGAKLNVDVLLTGRVEQTTGGLIIAAELVEARSNRQLW